MDKSNIVKLAKLLDNFTELESSFVLTTDIKAIRKSSEGMEVVTPHGAFCDSMDFDTFKTRVGDVLEALKEKEKSAPSTDVSKPRRRIIPLDGPAPSNAPPLEVKGFQEERPESPPIPRVTNVTFGKDGANGRLFPENENLSIVERDRILIQGPNEEILAKGSDSGQIKGELVSGIIYQDGRYTLADKEGRVNRVTVRYVVRKK